MPVTSKNLSYTREDTFSFQCLAQDYNQNILDLTGAQFYARAGIAGTTTTMDGVISNISIPNGTFTVTFPSTASNVFPDNDVELDYIVQVLTSPTFVPRYTVQAGKLYLTPPAF